LSVLITKTLTRPVATKRLRRQAFKESFQVKEIQRTVNGLIAYDAPFGSFESVRFQEDAKKPVLQALEDLSRKLLLAKPD
jgi:hypothetical protein